MKTIKMKTPSTVFFALLAAASLCAGVALQAPDAAVAENKGAKESTSPPLENKPHNPEAEKTYEACKEKCGARFKWCLQSNVSTDKFEVCGDAHDNCLKGCDGGR